MTLKLLYSQSAYTGVTCLSVYLLSQKTWACWGGTEGRIDGEGRRPDMVNIQYSVQMVCCVIVRLKPIIC